MTEDDTFRLLKRPSLHEMIDLWDDRWRTLGLSEFMNPEYTYNREIFMDSHGWTWQKFFNARKEYLNRTS